MIRTMFAVGLAVLTLASASALADSTDPGGPRAEPRDPGGIAVEPMPSGPSYPGPSVDTWLGTRYPPPVPPQGPGLTALPGQPRIGAAAILMQAAASPRQDEFEECMASGQAEDIDFVEAVGACFCLTIDDLSPGCVIDED